MKFLLPKRIYSASDARNCETLLKKKTMQIGLNETELSDFETGGFVLLDFGKEIRGGIRIMTFTAQNARVRIRFGESVSECCAEIGEKNATNDHSPRDLETVLPSYSDITLGGTGFRFVRIDAIEGSARLKSVYAASEILTKTPVYTYNGNDKRVACIFKTAKRTIDLCSFGGVIWDGIKRDRLVWIGDMYPEMIALSALYGRMECIENSLDLIRNEYPLPLWMNNFPSYSMWWINILADYYKSTYAPYRGAAGWMSGC